MEKSCHHHDPHPSKPSTRRALGSSFFATIHCLSGCLIGEVIGLIVSVTWGLGVGWTFMLSTFLAYLSGFLLATIPLMNREKLSFKQAIGVIWIGEVISIGVMEIVMNSVDYWMGGMQASSIFSFQFWGAMIIAGIVGFLAAWPINHLLLIKKIKRCH